MTSQSYGFSNSHVWMWELDHKEGWASKNWCFWTLALEKALKSPLDCKEIRPVNPKVNQPWIFIGEGLMVKLKLQYFGHLMGRTDSLEKTLMLGKIEDRRRRGWHRMRWLDSITDSMDMSLGKLLEMVREQGSLVCCSPRGCKELNMTEQLNNNNSLEEWACAVTGNFRLHFLLKQCSCFSRMKMEHNIFNKKMMLAKLFPLNSSLC